ncbi:pyridoxal phosphate-dependent aminotransferase [Pseudorhodobacter turbinis]|uniref:Aminotransferase n=1 Tax=Pseudorhodobacter turbinis TaxID=2500533 RepID=A0A4P8EI36_9RHOB|nr:pyridoxal phosphate-dependent aminotransferase [Pseudorhodobacter turbinis]QCO56443.1 pyridoxal phosphate-dependent aminotransferase [Pseudorhodobacter turbinis]
MSFEASRIKLIKPSPAITISTAAKAMKAAGEPVIDLSIGEPDFDTPENIIEAAYAAMKRGETRYTAPDGTPALKDAVIEKFRRENGLAFARENITCGNGAKQVIFNALMATLEPGDEVLCPAPYWVSYTDMALLLGGVPAVVECDISNGFKLTPDLLEAAITPKTRWILINTPSNPSGAAYTAAELRALGDILARHPRVLILSDEIYEQIWYADAPFTSFGVACPELVDRTVIVNGVAKAYAMTGWRIGYAAAPAALAKVMSKIQSQSTSNPCSISQAATIEALTGPQDYVEMARAEFRARRDLVIPGLRAIDGIQVLNPDGAFYAFPHMANFIGRRTPDGKLIETDTDLTGYLLNAAKVAGVQGAAFGLSPYFRMSYALGQDDLKIAISRISDALGALD